jgi:hypothetical protein
MSILEFRKQKKQLEERKQNSKLKSKEYQKLFQKVIDDINKSIINRINFLIMAASHPAIIRSKLTRTLESDKDDKDKISNKIQHRPQTEKILKFLKDNGIQEVSHKEHSPKSRGICDMIRDLVKSRPDEKVTVD